MFAAAENFRFLISEKLLTFRNHYVLIPAKAVTKTAESQSLLSESRRLLRADSMAVSAYPFRAGGPNAEMQVDTFRIAALRQSC